MNLRRIIIIALFAALIVAGAYIAVPVGPVPITLQTVFVLLAGILGGKGIGAASIAVYLTLGAIGLPVFSGGIGGFAHFVSPTGGFLISWLIAAPLAGAITDVGFRNNLDSDKTTVKQLVFVIIGTLTGTLIMYVIGIPYLKAVLQVTWKNAFIWG
ncbi:MAG: biotin transporter BioY, partial [Sphaerochaetaceae bacterium]|nr:biotin transporter BioY [Sphaerochaetaceae bacterium]